MAVGAAIHCAPLVDVVNSTDIDYPNNGRDKSGLYDGVLKEGEEASPGGNVEHGDTQRFGNTSYPSVRYLQAFSGINLTFFVQSA